MVSNCNRVKANYFKCDTNNIALSGLETQYACDNSNWLLITSKRGVNFFKLIDCKRWHKSIIFRYEMNCTVDHNKCIPFLNCILATTLPNITKKIGHMFCKSLEQTTWVSVQRQYLSVRPSISGVNAFASGHQLKSGTLHTANDVANLGYCNFEFWLVCLVCTVL